MDFLSWHKRTNASRIQRRTFFFLSLLLFSLSYLSTSYAMASTPNEPPKITANAAILINADTGEIYFEKNARLRRNPASLTKIMTGIVVIEANIGQELAKVSAKCARVSTGSTLKLNTGDCLAVQDLLKAALIISANDSTVALAEHFAGHEDLFLQMMNGKAFLVGMFGTNYDNTNGFSKPNHFTTAYDLAQLTRYALKDPVFAQLVSTKETAIQLANERGKIKTIPLRNTNKFLIQYPGATGIKTGTTAKAGNCLISAAKRDGRQLIAVVLKSRNRYADSIKLMDYGFKQEAK